MKPWKKMFMWIGVVATVAVFVFVVQQIAQGQNRKVAIRNFNGMLNQIFPERPPKAKMVTLTAQQRQELALGIKKIAPTGVLTFSTSFASYWPRTCGKAVAIMQESGSYVENGGSWDDVIEGSGPYAGETWGQVFDNAAFDYYANRCDAHAQ